MLEERLEQVREIDGELAYEKMRRAVEKASQEKARQESGVDPRAKPLPRTEAGPRSEPGTGKEPGRSQSAAGQSAPGAPNRKNSKRPDRRQLKLLHRAVEAVRSGDGAAGRAGRGIAGAVAAANPTQNPRIAYAERRVKPPARLLRCATALRVTAPLGCGSRRLVWPKAPFRLRPKYE